MDKNLDAYIKVYDNWLDPKKCKQTVKELKSVKWQQHTFYDSAKKSAITLSGENELDMSWDKNISTRDYVMKRIWDGYLQYINDLNFEWFTSWQGFTGVRFNRYVKNRVMAMHCDHIHTAFDGERKGIPTMSFVAVLNKNYEGGDLIMFDDKKIELTEGSAVVFPSCFLYPHRVTPVTKGVRYSCVSWAW